MEEKELELRDYINVIWERKNMILIIFFIAVFIATIVSFIMPKEYETSITIKNGYIKEPIIKNEAVKNMIMNSETINQIISETGINIGIPDILKGNIIEISDIKASQSFEAKVRYSNPQKAKEIAETIGKIYVEQGHKLYQQRVDLIKEKIETTESMINNTTQMIASTQDLQNSNAELINRIKNSITKEQGTSDLKTNLEMLILLDNYYMNNLMQLFDKNLSLLSEKENIEYLLIEAEDIKILSHPFLPKSPIKPNKKLNVKVSGVIGLMLGVFLAFFMEYWKPGPNKSQ